MITCSTYVALLPALLRWLKTVYQQNCASIVRNLAVAVARVSPEVPHPRHLQFNPADSGATIVPRLSELVRRIQFGGDELVKAKDGAGSTGLSMAYASAKFISSLLRGLNGERGIITPTFVKSPLFADQGIDFVSSNVEFGVRQIVSRF